MTSVLVVLHVPDQLRDEHSVQRPAGHKDVDDVRQGVAQAVGVRQGAESDRRDERHVPDQAGDPGGDRPGCHEGTRAQDPCLLPGAHEPSCRALLRRTKFIPSRNASSTNAPETT